MNRLTSTLLLVSCLGLTSAFLVACGGGAPIRPHFIEGVDAHDNGDLHGAIAAYEAALDEVPDDYKVHYNLALIYHELYEAALRAKDEQPILAWDAPQIRAREVALHFFCRGLQYRAAAKLKQAKRIQVRLARIAAHRLTIISRAIPQHTNKSSAQIFCNRRGISSGHQRFPDRIT